MLDASGRSQAGFVWGQNYWTTPRELCDVLENPVQIALSTRYKRINHANLTIERAPFHLEYNIVYLKHNSMYQLEQKIFEKNVLHIGICIPTTCSLNDTSTLIDKILKIYQDDYHVIGTNYSIIAAKNVKAGEGSKNNIFLIILV